MEGAYGTGTSATLRRCWMHRPVGPATQALGKDQRTESTLKSGDEDQGP